MTLIEPLRSELRPLFSGRRDHALARLAAFAPKAGRAYAGQRNYDFGPGAEPSVSMLSPSIRHRVVSEEDVVAAVLARHALEEASKFIQEVCWRTYWKGWLEQRPSVWDDYLVDARAARERVENTPALSKRFVEATRGETAIACFDAWVRELIETGYLHNHARMWFASIWIFTLKLPWELGADLFLRHLLDGDPASNTLSWRWVAGLHTVGKTYLARAGNIETYTGGRFRPEPGQLAETALALTEAPSPRPRKALRDLPSPREGVRAVLLVTEDDVSAGQWPIGSIDVAGIAVAAPSTGLDVSRRVADFRREVMEEAARDLAVAFKVDAARVSRADDLVHFAMSRGAGQIVTHYRPLGFMTGETEAWLRACSQAGLAVCEVMRAWDRAFWPHAKAGFFQLKDKIPSVLRSLGHL